MSALSKEIVELIEIREFLDKQAFEYRKTKRSLERDCDPRAERFAVVIDTYFTNLSKVEDLILNKITELE